MTETANLTLPLLAPSQAQKHVTVNEALTRLDGAVQLRLVSRSVTTPPAAAVEGACYGVPNGAVNDWAGHAGEIAQFTGGGWAFFAPQRGWRAFVADRGSCDLFDGQGWRAGGVSLSPGGGGMRFRSVEADIAISTGTTVTAGLSFPERALVYGVTGRVTEAITGTLTSWQLGDAGNAGRFGTGLGLAQNSWVNGPAAPFVVWNDTPLILGATGGDFAGGTVRLVAHYAAFDAPDAV